MLNTNQLRRDEIWFSQKSSGSTEIFRFDNLEDSAKTNALARGDIRIESAYLNGRYRGVPNITTVIDAEV